MARDSRVTEDIMEKRAAQAQSEVAGKTAEDLEVSILKEALEENEEHSRRAFRSAKGVPRKLSKIIEGSKSLFSHIDVPHG